MAALPALLRPRVRSFINTNSSQLFNWTRALGSPLFILFPEELVVNIHDYRDVLQGLPSTSQIYFASKVNKSSTFLSICAGLDIGIDVSSSGELGAALAHGIRGENIVLTGPGKTRDLLFKAIRHRCIVSVDSLQDISRLNELKQAKWDLPLTRVFIRLSGFNRDSQRESSAYNSRFGIHIDDWAGVLEILDNQDARSSVKLWGISFHLDNHDPNDRSSAIWAALQCGLEARRRGHPFRCIDAGGGIPIQYIDKRHWDRFTLSYDHRLNFRERTIGIASEPNGAMNGPFYPHNLDAYRADFLRKILEWTPPTGGILQDCLRTHRVGLAIEPGRSLLDQCGITVCEVTGPRKSSRGDDLLGLNMNISHMWDQFIGTEFASDPIHLTQPGRDGGGRPLQFHFVGNLCLESDVLAWRQVPFESAPHAGDLLIFANTAGYQMDFAESRMHRHSTPGRIATFKEDDRWDWRLDENFSALDVLLRRSKPEGDDATAKEWTQELVGGYPC